MMPLVASFHLVRHASVAAAGRSLAMDRLLARRTDGLEFVRVLGTGAGSGTGPGVDPRRTALFALWTSEAAFNAFVDKAWPRSAERYHVLLRASGGHGAWKGRPVLDEIEQAPGDTDVPIAVITRASVRLRHWRAFRAAGDPVSAELQLAPGLRAVVAFGEAPVGKQGTFSVWDNAAAARAFAVGQPRHRDVVARTRADGWYGEELFARFEPYGSRGSWDGRDPLCRDSTGTSIP